MVDLAEGPRMMSRVEGLAPEAVAIGMAVRARIVNEDGKAFVVKMKNGGTGSPYVQRVTLNGKPLTTPFIDYADIMSGAELVFEMGDQKTVFWRNL